METETASLGRLSNELLLEIVLHLSTIRSYETQSTAFKQKATEKRRQRENRLRQLALYSLCLTSHQFNQIATPILYASFTGSTTFHGIEPLRLFRKTIAETKDSNGKSYTAYLQYVENRLADYLGNDLIEDATRPDAANMVVEYFSLLAEVINSASNLQHLSVVSLENDKFYFWKHLVHEQQDAETASFSFVAEHGLRNLQVLSVQTNISASQATKEAYFQGICSAAASLPSLSDFRSSRFAFNKIQQPPVDISHFKKLQRIEITECVLMVNEVADLLSACEGLRHIVCVWDFQYCVRETPWDLRRGLLRHSSTLEMLVLDFRKTRWDFDHTQFKEIGSLRQLERLEALTISKLGYTRGDWFNNPDEYREKQHELNLVDLLPMGLKKFNLLLNEADFELEPDALDSVPELHRLPEACKSSVLELEEVTVTCTCDVRGVRERIDDFAKAGVLLNVVIEP